MGLGENIQRIRELRKLTIQQLADKMGIGKAGIYKWEGNETKPGQESLTALAKALDVTVNDLLNENLTLVEKGTNNNEKADPSINEAIRNLLEGNTDYILIHKVVILEKYRLQSIEQAEKDKQELRDREKQISELHEIIKLMVTTGKQPDTVKTLEVKEGK